MTGFANNLISDFAKRTRVRPAPARLHRRALRLESLEQRSMLTAMAPVDAPLPDLPATDDVIVDGHIITGENFDAASAADPSIVRKITGRTNYQPLSTSAYGGSAGRDILFGGLGSDGVLESASSGHSGGGNVLLGDGSVHFNRHSGGMIVVMGDGSVRFISDSIGTVLANDLQRETDANATAGPIQSEWKYVPVRRMASPSTTDTGADLRGRQISFTGLEETSGSEVSRSFSAYGGFTGGVFVGAGDVNGDGRDDIIVGAGPGATGGHVKIIDGNRTIDVGNDWLVGGTGRDNVSASAVFGPGSGVWHLRNSSSPDDASSVNYFNGRFLTGRDLSGGQWGVPKS